MDAAFDSAAAAVRAAEALMITAGAGMGVDSGLPDFRGTEGFWRAYPAFGKLGLRFEQLASPAWFDRDPAVAWGFYGHRLKLYRATTPHGGFSILRRWAETRPLGCFVFTSNVDGHFQKAGFPPESIVECHGSIHHLQCVRPCCGDVWPADGIDIDVDEQTMRAAGPFPRCRFCGGLARPNVLMFGDGRWVESRTERRHRDYRQWLRRLGGSRLAVIECGAGTAVPTVRLESERLAGHHGATLVRINLREPKVPPGPHMGLAAGALAALTAIDERLKA